MNLQEAIKERQLWFSIATVREDDSIKLVPMGVYASYKQARVIAVANSTDEFPTYTMPLFRNPVTVRTDFTSWLLDHCGYNIDQVYQQTQLITAELALQLANWAKMNLDDESEGGIAIATERSVDQILKEIKEASHEQCG